MPPPQANTVIPPKSPQVLAQELDNQAKEVEANLKQQQAEFEKNQSDLATAQAQCQIDQIEAELASAALDMQRRIEKARAPVEEAERIRAAAQKQFEGMKRDDPQKVATLETTLQDKTLLETARTKLTKAEEALTMATAQKKAAEEAFNEIKKTLEKAEADLKATMEEQGKLTLDDRAKAQEAQRAWKECEAEHKKAQARFNAEKFEAEKEYAKLASDARKRQLAIVTALSASPRPAPAG